MDARMHSSVCVFDVVELQLNRIYLKVIIQHCTQIHTRNKEWNAHHGNDEDEDVPNRN